MRLGGRVLGGFHTGLLALAAAAVFVLPADYAKAAQAENYLEANEAEYACYAALNPDFCESKVLTDVNLMLHLPNYEGVKTVKHPESVTVFLNKHYRLPEGYVPEGLIRVDTRYAKTGERLRADSCAAFMRMAEDAEREELSLYICSGYRINRENHDADDVWNARRFHSEHQTGLAFDLSKKGLETPTLGEQKYQRTDEYLWLTENAWRYGFILSYPKGKTDITGFAHEPWHWRYVGEAVATDMKEKGFATYSEYWAAHLIQHTSFEGEYAMPAFTAKRPHMCPAPCER